MVAKRVRDALPLKLSAHWEVDALNTTGSRGTEDGSFLPADGAHSEVFQTLKESFLKAFKVMDKELRMNTNFDCLCSGTTAVTMVKQVMQ